MPLTQEQQLLKDQAIAGRNQRFLQDVEQLAAQMAGVFEKMNSIGLYVAINPDVAALDDAMLASLGKHYNAAKLQASLLALSEIKAAAETNSWTAKILGVY